MPILKPKTTLGSDYHVKFYPLANTTKGLGWKWLANPHTLCKNWDVALCAGIRIPLQLPGEKGIIHLSLFHYDLGETEQSLVRASIQ
jgi:hypothetical protein